MKKPLIALFTVVISVISFSASAAPMTLAENTHLVNESAGDNSYTFGTTIGAENFTLGGTFDILSISHVGHYLPLNLQPDIIDWWLYSDSAGKPGATLFSGRSLTFDTAVEGASDGFDLIRYSIDLATIPSSPARVTLGAGSYWVGFHITDGQADGPHWTFASAGTSFDGLSAISTDGGANWNTPYPGGNMTFRVVGDVVAMPEPSITALFAAGLFGLGFVRRRKHS